jgi:hypothetical protein
MKIIQTFIAVLAVFAFTGCGTICRQSLPAKMSGLELGMSKEQVIHLLGKPAEAGTGTHYSAPGVVIGDGFSEVFRYAESPRGQAQDCIVVFFDDKVTEYGPFTGDLQIRYGGVFSAR